MAVMYERQVYSHAGTAGEALQTITIPVPKTRWSRLQYSYFVEGTANALANSLTAKLTHTGEVSMSNVTLGSAIFTSLTTNTGTGTILALADCTHLEWQVRSAAGTSNEFLLFLKFLDV